MERPRVQGQLNNAIVPSDDFPFVTATAYSSLAHTAGGLKLPITVNINQNVKCGLTFSFAFSPIVNA